MTRCVARGPFRCWQYRANDGTLAVPFWAAVHLQLDEKQAKFIYPDSSNEWTLDDGDWVIEYSCGPESIFDICTAAQFEAQFIVYPEGEDS
jgi:hypothetical protein